MTTGGSVIWTLVTGATGGIGAAVCRELAQRGASVAVAGRRLGACEQLAGELSARGVQALPVELDVTDEASISAALACLRDAGGPTLRIVNNAGIAESAPLASDPEQYERHLQVNFHGPRRLLEAALPDMFARGRGDVVQVASSAGLRGYTYVAAYAASKHALLGYTRSAALELVRKGIALGAVCPHYVDSPMTDESIARVMEKTGKSEAEARAFFAGENPGGVLVTPHEVAVATCDLLDGDLSGRVLELIGGETRVSDEGFKIQRPDAPEQG